MGVPLLDLKTQNAALEPELKRAFERVLQSGMFILGPEVDALEAALAAKIGVKHAVTVSSGTDALVLALMALGIGPGDEVLVPTFTFFATAGSVHRLGATPVFVDACPACFNLDVREAAAKVTPRTKAILPVHLFGQAADMDAVLALAKQHKLAVVEDCAQSLGATYKGRQVGTFGEFGTYSFFPSKNLGGFGDGGLLVTNDDALADKARILRVHGMKPKYYHKFVGANFRLDALQCALLGVKLPHYDGYNARRQANAAYYLEKLKSLPGVAVADIAHCCHGATVDAPAGAKLILPAACPHNGHIWNQFTLRVPGTGRRDALREHLQRKQIGHDVYYPLVLEDQECFAPLRGKGQGSVVAKRLASEVLSIPVYPELSRAQQDEVIAALAEFVK